MSREFQISMQSIPFTGLCVDKRPVTNLSSHVCTISNSGMSGEGMSEAGVNRFLRYSEV